MTLVIKGRIQYSDMYYNSLGPVWQSLIWELRGHLTGLTSMGRQLLVNMKGTMSPMRTNILMAILSLLWLSVVGKTLTPEETESKADFIIKAVDYVTWPEGAGTNADGAIVIGVVGESPLMAKLTEMAATKTAEGTKIVVKSLTLEDDLTVCQVLFMSTEDKADLAKILKKLKQAPILTISDAEYFARYGVMVNFIQEAGDSSVKFEVNKMVLGFAGLKMSSRLLKLATII